MNNDYIIELQNININHQIAQEENIVVDAIKGNKQAFVSLIEIYKEYLYKTAYLYTKNQHDAADIYQETVYKAFISIHKLKNPVYFKTWLTKILINNTNDMFRKGSRVFLTDDNEVSTLSQEFEDIEKNLDLYNAIDNLCGKYKTAIILRYMQDMTIKDISFIMGCPENTVKSYIHRALKFLKINLLEE